jgi:hypothetical protein
LDGGSVESWAWACGRSTHGRRILTLSETWMDRACKSAANQFWHLAIPDDADIRMVWRSWVSLGLDIVLDRVRPIYT